jgi:hypothetical protein
MGEETGTFSEDSSDDVSGETVSISTIHVTFQRRAAYGG